MSVKDNKNQYAALAPAVPNTVSRSLAVGDRSFGDVVFESGKPVLDCELNLQQDAQRFVNALVSKKSQQSGFYRGQTRQDSFSDFYFDTPPTIPENCFAMKRVEAVVAGFPLVIEYANTPIDGENIIQLDEPPIYDPMDPTSIKRTDFVFLEVWQALVAPSPQAKATATLSGVVAGDTLTLNPGAIILTAVLGPPGPLQFQVGGSDAATAINLAAAINLLTDFTATATGPFVTLWTLPPTLAGVAGNAATLLGTGGISPLAATPFAGGADRPNKPNQYQLYRHGNVQSDTATWLPDDLMDPALHAETTQRVQVQYRIRTFTGLDYKAHPDGFSETTLLAQGGSPIPVVNYQFVPADGVTTKGNSSAPAYGVVDNGLWIAGDGTPLAALELNSLDGYVYAIPIGMVFRHNQSEGAGFGFDPKNNTNGGPTWAHANYQNVLIDPAGPPLDVLANLSDRPDGQFADVIDPTNLLDLRRHVNPMGVDLKAELQYQIQSLMDGTNRTWAIDTADKQQMGNGSGDVSTQPMICDAIGRTDSVDGTNEFQGNTARGTTIRNFDHICRRFADQPVAERVVVAFYPNDAAIGAFMAGDYVAAPVVINASAAGSNPILFTTAAAHGYNVGDYIEIVGHSIAAVNRKWVVSSTPLPTTFTVSYDNTAGPAGLGGTAHGVGVVNPAKYVVKAGGAPYRWYEDDQLVFDLNFFDVTSDGGIFDGRTWVSTAAGAPPPAGINFPAYAPAGTRITNVLSVYHDDGHFGAPIDQKVQVKSITGLGTLTVTLKLDANGLSANSGLLANNVVGDPVYNPDHLLVRPNGDPDPINGSERRIFVEFEVTYPRGENGTTNTPTLLLQPNSPAAFPPPDGVYPFGLTATRNRALVENYSPARPLDWHNLTGVLYRDGHREAQLEYQVGTPLTAPFPSPIVSNTRLADEIVSRTTRTLYFPRRVFDERGGVQVTDLSTGGVVTVDDNATPYGSSTRQVVLDVGTPLFRDQTRSDIEYYALDAIPNSGPTTEAYQLSFYYRTNAPQTVGVHFGDFVNTVGSGQVPPLLPVEPMITSEMLLTGQVGMGSVDGGFPYVAPLDQIPIYNGRPLVASSVSIDAAPAGVSNTNPTVIQTTAAHGYNVGHYITIAGTSVAGVNGTWVVTGIPAPNQFAIAYDNSAGAAGGGGFSYTTASTPTFREWYIAGSANIAIADFSTNTGLLNLPTYVTQDGTQVLQLGGTGTFPVLQRPVADAEFRVLYPFTDALGYHPTVMSEPLMGPVTHKVFVPFLARALYDSGPYAARNTNLAEDGLLYRKNEILLVVLSRFATLDANNEVVFTNSPADFANAAVYRTRNLLLTVGE